MPTEDLISFIEIKKRMQFALESPVKALLRETLSTTFATVT